VQAHGSDRAGDLAVAELPSGNLRSGNDVSWR
jgi:hypothetical protein